MTTKIAKAGKLICVDSGSYSDYSVTGFFVVLKDFSPMDELEIYLNQNPKNRETYCFSESGFLGFLHQKGFLLDIEYGNLYLGAYSQAEEVRFSL